MKQQQLKKLVRMLPPKQQILDFGKLSPWAQLPAADQRACRDAIAALLCHVAVESRDKYQTQRER